MGAPAISDKRCRARPELRQSKAKKHETTDPTTKRYQKETPRIIGEQLTPRQNVRYQLQVPMSILPATFGPELQNGDLAFLSVHLVCTGGGHHGVGNFYLINLEN